MAVPESMEEGLRTRLRPAAVPPAATIWRRLVPALAARPARGQTRRRLLQSGGGAVLAVLATVSIALASSPQLRQQLGALSAVGGSGNRLTSLQPAPPFTVFQPTTLPDGWQLLVRAYRPDQASSGQTHGAVPTAMLLAAGAGGKGDAALEQAATEGAQQLLATSTTSALVLIYTTGEGQRIDLLEQRAGGRGLPAGTPVALHQTTGVATQVGTDAVLTWVEQGTWLELHTPLGQTAALRFADRLRPSAVTTSGSVHAPPEQPAPATPIPLSRRVAAVTTPAVTDATLADRCGAWREEPGGQLSIAGSQQATCVAKAVVSNAAFSSVGVSVIPWRDAAAQLGLDPARGPDGNPLVLAVDLEDGAGVAGWQVILDKGTGHPYLVVQLQHGSP